MAILNPICTMVILSMCKSRYFLNSMQNMVFLIVCTYHGVFKSYVDYALQVHWTFIHVECDAQ